ncbi:hypothetical protein ACJW30_05G156600 [Castanea mollissima]
MSIDSTLFCSISTCAFEKHSVEKDVAEHIKKEFDKKLGSTWHCTVIETLVTTLPNPYCTTFPFWVFLGC